MGQKANTLTLRKNNETLNAYALNFNELWNSEAFIKALKRSFDKKGVIITAIHITKNEKTLYLSLDVFFKCQKLIKYKKKIKRIFTIKKTSRKKKLKKKAIFKKASFNKLNNIKNQKYKGFSSLLQNALKNKLIVVKLNLINKKEDLDIKLNFLEELKKFKRSLFSRRAYLFYDFIKLSSLFINKKIDTKAYCNILGTIFKFLPKRSHGKFFYFIKDLFDLLLKESTSQIKGIRVLINGKLKGKLRASSFKASVGKINIQTLSATTELHKVHIFTLYGCFGLSLWANYKKTQKEEIEIKKKRRERKIKENL